ncbi:SIR2 family protein [Neomoorella mulderi]|uniref:NAD-dependent protein deacetylase n=1 Tax=Moorella mulderi DSM 14980 TaxID=1122241 RepID=A0A151AXU9_9FIRM|nr:SIR2 family protein [Moorella mulderi]KYH32461.1 NAD-dependent protein deacetylase [Moorella mulderi DSM 14980]
MWIKSVDLPEELIKAQEDGKLVIFAGAGVSRGSPSGLPDFEGLVRGVIERTGSMLSREEGEPADRFLGRLEKMGPKVHKIVQEILNPPGSRPNRLHYGLLSIFRTPEMVRLVTTNLDTHFSTAAAELFDKKLPIYRAPALPVGHRFHGIVYLHGCVDQEPGELVLTDGDFGCAYLTEGWATNFLKGLFTQYVVLFVGYSHNDLIMEYLARGLFPGSPRFALVSQEREKQTGGIILYPYAKWFYRGITPVPYLPTEGDTNHEALVEVVNAWAERAKMGLLDHEERNRRIVAESRPPHDPEKANYLEEALRDPATAGIFIRYADTPEWLHWLEEGGFLKPLFQQNSIGDDHVSPILACWFTDKFVLRHPEDALAVIQRQGPVLNPLLWQHIARALAFSQQPSDPAALVKWVTVLLSSPPPVAEQRWFLEDLLEKCRYPEDRDVALLLFKELTAPHLSSLILLCLTFNSVEK